MNKLTAEIIKEFKRRVFDEYYVRIFKCLSELTDEEILQRPNKHTNSVANLILHNCGNAEQWIIGGFTGKDTRRKRSEEFVPQQNITKKELIIRLDKLKSEMLKTLDKLDENDLLKTYNVQVFRETGIAILLHVMEHFSWHTGQITSLTKMIADKSLDFYTIPLE